jgi:hypothetical protein
MARIVCCFSALATLILAGTTAVHAQYVVVPGTGQKIAGDDFEARGWTYQYNLPKASSNLDDRPRAPLGVSSNGLWYESAKRGQPDLIRCVPTPPGGLRGSKRALLIRTRDSGVPGVRTTKSQQDDLLFNTKYNSIPISWSPNATIRVFVPKFDKWDARTDTSFGYRLGVMATTFEYKTRRGGLFRRSRRKRVEKREMHYPGMFLQFRSKADGAAKDSAYFIIRADDYGRDFRGPDITKTGWWTLGMSLTPDGRIHYFAHPGVKNLTAKDRIYSSQYGGVKFETFETFFLDILSRNDGRTWSTAWIIDDPAVHIGSRR